MVAQGPRTSRVPKDEKMRIYLSATFWLCVLVQPIFSQTLKGTVSNEYGNPLEGVSILSPETKKGTTTDAKGRFVLSLAPGNYVLEVSYVGYTSQTLKAKVGDGPVSIQVELVSEYSVLNEVVLSASREAQLRSEVPAALGILGSKAITETKAVGFDQLVNQVSGVFMSSSAAASNEQHFMAVRSPISTKALFLYLEDGLPIRPTSVFNHNALLEMNDLAYGRIEVLKGPASSMYGSESVGGSFNFITKSPATTLTATLGYQVNTLGWSRYEVEVSDSPREAFGFYLGALYANRKDGPIGHSDYEKFGFTFKTVAAISDRLEWTQVFDLVDYRSDMTGSLTEADYLIGDYSSDQTFTKRDVLAFRARSSLAATWNNRQRTVIHTLFRKNEIDQNPSYRIRQFREMGHLTGFGMGETNSDQFNSFMVLLQHKLTMGFKNSSFLVGGTMDFSPQKYTAVNTDVRVDTTTGQNIDFRIREGDFILNYEADILNYAGFAQYEIEPLERFKITAAIRFDRFEYVYHNRLEHHGKLFSLDKYEQWAPKIGGNFNFNHGKGIYANYSRGFSPPQVSTLYRNRNALSDIKPSSYDNYEIGSYVSIGDLWKFDGALYVLTGRNTLITLRDAQDNFVNTNAGKTLSYGIEYGIKYSPFKTLSVTHNGSYAVHRYVQFFDSGIDYSGTERETAPKLLGNSVISYQPFESLGITVVHNLVGAYNTSYENQVVNDRGDRTTVTYAGHSIFDLRTVFKYKQLELWAHLLNFFNERYAVAVSYNPYRNENSFTIGNPRALHFGVRWHF